MADTSAKEPDCDMCGSVKGLSFVFITQEPIKKGTSLISNDPAIVCRDHWQELVDNDEFYVRTIAPVPKERGGFSRTSDAEGGQILYDREEGDDCWIQFDPDDEIDLADSEKLSGETND